MTDLETTIRGDLSEAERRFQAGDLQESDRLYAQVAQSGAANALRAAGLYGRGVIKLNQRAPSAAENLLLEAYRLDTSNANACYYLGVVRQSAGDSTEATRWFASALIANALHRGALDQLAAIAGSQQPDGAQPITQRDRTTQSEPATEPARSEPAGEPARLRPPRQPSSPHAVIGIASHVRQQPIPWRGKPAAMVQLTFRLDTYSADGVGPGPSLAVELRNHEIRGTVDDGDWVELPPDFNPDKPAKELRNLSTGARVHSKYRILNAR